MEIDNYVDLTGGNASKLTLREINFLFVRDVIAAYLFNFPLELKTNTNLKVINPSTN